MNKLRIFLACILVSLLALTGCDLLLPPPPPPAGILTVSFLDVGQADCIVIRSGASAMLIDAGTNAGAASLVDTLYRMGIRKFDVVVGTHPHEDHIGGMDAIINNFEVGTIYMPNAMADTKTFLDVLTAIKNRGLKVISPAPGDSFTLGEANCAIVAPNKDGYDDTNNYSIVIRVAYGKKSFLFTGDAQSVSEKEMLAKDYDLSADVLKIGHHGSETSTTQNFLNAVSPEYAVIMVGDGNDYGHPHQETLDKLKTVGVNVYRTDRNGTVTFTSDGSNLTVITER